MKVQPTDKHRLLFVCLGNICRSPAAEGIMQHLVDQVGRAEEFVIDSAGLGGWHIGMYPDPRMTEAARQKGYHLNSRARQIKAYDFDDFDLILCMDEGNRDRLMDLAPSIEAQEKIQLLSNYIPEEMHANEIPDPYYGGSQGFERVISLIEAACRNLLMQL